MKDVTIHTVARDDGNDANCPWAGGKEVGGIETDNVACYIKDDVKVTLL